MIKKLLITLLVLIMLLVSGVVSLVVFVDPNNFRGFISNTIKETTGYELTINGDLRWHIWPQISILTDSIRLEDRGAKVPLLTADNMRLDVELMPLFSKGLSVKNVLIKSAVINVTDDSKGNVAKNNKPTATINQTPAIEQKANATDSDWSVSLNKLEIADSTIILQQDKDVVSFRDINASITQQNDKNVAVTLSGNINRNQQDFVYSLDANVDLTNFPQSAQVALTKLSYDYSGVGVPANRLQGELKATLNYQRSPFVVESQDLVFTVNNNQIDGKLKANLDNKAYFEALLSSETLDLTPFVNSDHSTKSNSDKKVVQTDPVVVKKASNNNELAFLNMFDAKFKLTVDKILVDQLVIDNFVIDADNKNGVAKLNDVSFYIAQGHIAANGTANGNQTQASVKLATAIDQIDLGTLFQQLELADHVKGQLNAKGNVATNAIAADKLMKALTGDLAISVTNARFENLNIEQIIQSNLSQYTKDVVTSGEIKKYTEFHEISSKANIVNGNMNLSSIKALSETLNVTGKGRVGLVAQDLDTSLEVTILSGWNGKSETIQKLQKLAIPLRIYGEFDQLHYQLEAEKIIKNLLNSKLQQNLDKSKVLDALGGLLNRSKDKK